MKCKFLNADALMEAIGLIAEELDITLTDSNDAELTVNVESADADSVSVTLDGSTAAITYGGGIPRFLRGLATLIGWVRDGRTEGSVTETPCFTTNGSMVDMSRNAVMNVDTVCFMMRKMALMGMNMFMLYTEDTYEVPEQPYFGYMRGRYTREEIRTMDAYAASLGIELIPCIQMLGHLATALRWSAMASIRDTQNALLVGSDKTYAFLDDLLRTVSESFTTRRIHIGMDETHDLGTGRSLDLFGYTERSELYFAHLAKVTELCEKYGLEPMMWSDMFFRLAGKGLNGLGDYDSRVVIPDDMREKVPQNVGQVFWDYYHSNEDFYLDNIDKHRKFTDKVLFAGGVWGWSGPCMLYSLSRSNTIPALEACKKQGVREVIATVWHNGSEANLVLALAGLAWYADFDYTGRFDEDSVRVCFKNAVGLSYDDFLATEKPDFLGGLHPVTRALLYNDPLIGLADVHFDGLNAGEYYRALEAEQTALGEGTGRFAPAFDTVKKLTSLLVNKADFGIRLKAAYDARDREALASLAEECDIIREKLSALMESHCTAWMEYNKPFGWEVHDIRYGGQLARFATAKARISAYLAGDIPAIEELEAPRLRFDGRAEGSPTSPALFLWQKYTGLATANIL